LRTLYAVAVAKGLYKSTDGGKTFVEKTKDVGLPDNRNFWVLSLHPDGTLYCVITIGYKDGKPRPGGVFRSKDGGDTWEHFNKKQALDFPFGIAVDPRDSDVVYVSCFNVVPEGEVGLGAHSPWPKWKGGGVYKTTDGGKSWKRILEKDQCWEVKFHPRNPDKIYACAFADGVWISEDGGKTWLPPLEHAPHILATKTTLDPKNDRIVYVSTFGGGMWQGTIQE
jgi:hypothetical protein